MTVETMNPDSVFVIDTERFAHETVDGEVIIIDMDEGNYFSMRDSAAAIWKLLEEKLPHFGIVEALSTACGLSAEEVTPSIDAFLKQLTSEKILSESRETGHTGVHPVLDSLVFSPPRYEKHTEMQDLLTLDPIHEVDDTGWPHRAKPGND